MQTRYEDTELVVPMFSMWMRLRAVPLRCFPVSTLCSALFGHFRIIYLAT